MIQVQEMRRVANIRFVIRVEYSTSKLDNSFDYKKNLNLLSECIKTKRGFTVCDTLQETVPEIGNQNFTNQAKM